MKRLLPGEWTAETKSGPITASFALVSNESALMERWKPGSGHETMTVFHADHADLLLTHYCAQGNQPRLRAVVAAPDAIVFRFVSATNVGPQQSILVERTLRLGSDGFDDVETYKEPNGALETTAYHFQHVAPLR